MKKPAARIRELELKLARMEDKNRALLETRSDLYRKAGELYDEIREGRQELAKVNELKTQLEIEKATLEERLQGMEQELKKERARVTQAFDTAEEAAHAAGSIGRLAYGLSETLQSLEVTITNLNKEKRK